MDDLDFSLQCCFLCCFQKGQPYCYHYMCSLIETEYIVQSLNIVCITVFFTLMLVPIFYAVSRQLYCLSYLNWVDCTNIWNVISIRVIFILIALQSGCSFAVSIKGSCMTKICSGRVKPSYTVICNFCIRWHIYSSITLQCFLCCFYKGQTSYCYYYTF